MMLPPSLRSERALNAGRWVRPEAPRLDSTRNTPAHRQSLKLCNEHRLMPTPKERGDRARIPTIVWTDLRTAWKSRWLAARKAEVLPCPYFHVTITVPEELREVLRANQKDGYALLMKASVPLLARADEG